jgi:hypothetical protein
MALNRFILRFRGDEKPNDQIDRIRALPGIKLLDVSPRMLLVEGRGDLLRDLIKSMPDWVLTPQATVSLPTDPRPRIARAR